MSLRLTPIPIVEACEFVRLHHRHHPPPVGGLFAVAVSEGDEVRGVAVVGRPVGRHDQEGYTAEVTRVCTLGDDNACSMLYGACWRAAKARAAAARVKELTALCTLVLDRFDLCVDDPAYDHGPAYAEPWPAEQEGVEADTPAGLPVPPNADKRYEELDGG